jgi:hypothetical protein
MNLIYLNFFFLALIIYQIFSNKIIENYDCNLNKPSKSDCQDLTIEKNWTDISEIEKNLNELKQKKTIIKKQYDKNNKIIDKNIKDIKNLNDS